jgi:hypothetical protein
MGSKTEGGVLNIHIHFGNKTDVDMCRISLVKNIKPVHSKEIVWSHPADYLLGYDRLYEHHTFGSNGDPPESTTSATCG